MRKQCFLGILENVSANIIELPLKHGFRFELFTYPKLEDILLGIVGDGWHHGNEYDHLYGYFEKKGRKENYVVITRPLAEITDEIVSYLYSVIEKMRLFIPGNARIIWYCYHDEIKEGDVGGGTTESVGSTFGSEILETIDHSMYNISKEEIPALQTFIEEIRLPFKHNYLKLAYQTYQKTYDINDTNLSFLVSMIGMELLLNPSHIEVTHRVSRNAAVLLGMNRGESNEIFKRMKKLYNIRSNIVHGNLVKIKVSDELYEIRSYLLKSIIKISIMDTKKDDLMVLLDMFGFGEMDENLKM